MKDRIPVYIGVEGTPSEADDEDVPGAYLVMVDSDLPEEDRPSAALDIFHEHIGIECLDDFTITAYDAEGNALSEKDQAEDYALGNRGEFCGVVDAIPTPPGSTPTCG